ncbi:hypothetical protein ACHAWF_017587 [Thalassiosira exigua]
MTPAAATMTPSSSSIPLLEGSGDGDGDGDGATSSLAASPGVTAAAVDDADGPDALAERKKSKRGVSPPLERLFLAMHHRKLERDLNGPQKKKTRFHFVALGCMLVLVYGLSAYENGSEDMIISLSLGQIFLIGTWIFVSVVVATILGNSKFVVLLYWMLIYWPLLAIVASLLFYNRSRHVFDDPGFIGLLLVIAEVLTLVAFVVVYYVYPRLVTSKWFRETYGAARFWRIKLFADEVAIVMEYDGWWGRFGRRYRCRYVGELNADGVPHGRGVWSDDSYGGEILSGTWRDGSPVAPFRSRQYGGRGNTFSAVTVACFVATDDDYESNKLVPTNDEPPRCGVVGVECSVAGSFMSHLPEASILVDLGVEGEGLAIGGCCRELDRGAGATSTKPVTALRIASDDPRGVQVGGHRFVPTGHAFTRRVKQIVIDVASAGPKYDPLDMTAAASEEDELEEVMVRQEEGGGGGGRSDASTAVAPLCLEVKNWARVQRKDALIFLPGFNSVVKHSVETFGQMLAMSKLTQHVYPVLFAWPGGQVPTYRHASFISASENNRKHFLKMLQGLQSEGIQNIHIISHSLGVQTLMSVFEDADDGSPSPVSNFFVPAPTHSDAAPSVTNLGKQLVCRSITMLNPDFPVQAFREKGFRSIRRVAQLITVVGDATDQALFWSSLINGLCNFFDYAPSSVLDSEARREEKGFHLQQPIGRNIDCLYVERDTDHGDANAIFQPRRGSVDSVTLGDRPQTEHTDESAKDWLDCDVIDTTGLDTNVNNLRHSAFNVNSILLRDIEEIIVTGKRAADRATLLHIKGNVFEYCHAPSFVSY